MAAQIYPPTTRRSSRHPIALDARLCPVDADSADGRGAILARTVDLSDSGLSVTSREPVTCDSRVVVQVDLPDGRTFCCGGRVAWTHAHSDAALVGIAFDAPSFELARQRLVEGASPSVDPTPVRRGA